MILIPIFWLVTVITSFAIQCYFEGKTEMKDIDDEIQGPWREYILLNIAFWTILYVIGLSYLPCPY